MHRLIVDNDGTNLFLQSMTSDIEGSIRDAVEMCSDSVTTYMLCAGSGTYLYPTKVGEVTPEIDLFPSSKHLHAALRRGVDPFGMCLEALRKSGKETFITLRMNDVHNPDDPTGWNTSIFKKEHPEMVVDPEAVAAGTDDWLCYCLDYSRREVRDYFLAIIREIVTMYDIDGLQLDWMRFPRHLPGNCEAVWQKRHAITEFMSDAREILHSSGKNILLTARVPTSLKGCRQVGFDIAEWTRLGLVDFLTASPFLTTDFAMPILEMRNALGSNLVPVYGCIEFGHGGYQSHSPESLRAAALGLYDSGVDGIYLFNFPCWNAYIASTPYHWLDYIDESRSCEEKPLLFSVAHTACRLDMDLPGQLPVSLQADESVDLTLHLPDASIPSKSALVLVHSHGDVSLSVNGFEAADLDSPFRRRTYLFVEYPDSSCPNDQQASDEDCRVFRVNPTHLKPGINELSIHNTSKKTLNVSRVNMGVW